MGSSTSPCPWASCSLSIVWPCLQRRKTMFLLKMFQRKWLLATLLVVAGAALCVRLGIWQLDRLDQRRVFNHQVESMRAMSPLDLNQQAPEDIATMEWRAVKVQGKYDFANQFA